MAKLTGYAIVRQDGLSLRMKEAEVDFGGMERTSVFADGKRAGYTEAPSSGKVKGTLIHGSDSNLFKVRDAVSVTITFVTDTGVTFTIRDAACTKPPVLKSAGECDVEYEGEPVF